MSVTDTTNFHHDKPNFDLDFTLGSEDEVVEDENVVGDAQNVTGGNPPTPSDKETTTGAAQDYLVSEAPPKADDNLIDDEDIDPEEFLNKNKNMNSRKAEENAITVYEQVVKEFSDKKGTP